MLKQVKHVQVGGDQHCIMWGGVKQTVGHSGRLAEGTVRCLSVGRTMEVFLPDPPAEYSSLPHWLCELTDSKLKKLLEQGDSQRVRELSLALITVLNEVAASTLARTTELCVCVFRYMYSCIFIYVSIYIYFNIYISTTQIKVKVNDPNMYSSKK